VHDLARRFLTWPGLSPPYPVTAPPALPVRGSITRANGSVIFIDHSHHSSGACEGAKAAAQNGLSATANGRSGTVEEWRRRGTCTRSYDASTLRVYDVLDVSDMPSLAVSCRGHAASAPTSGLRPHR
jgi:hypothetical protein